MYGIVRTARIAAGCAIGCQCYRAEPESPTSRDRRCLARPSASPSALLWLPFAAMGASATLSLVSGTVLGYLAGTQHGLTDRWTEAVQAHGHLQLLGWAAVFVSALLFEFAVRFNQRGPLPAL